MYPTLFTIGKVAVPSYTVLLDLGLILGLVLTYFEGKRQLGRSDLALDLGLWTVIGGIVGGRIGYVLTYLSAFREKWVQIFQIWKGGLTFLGAFVGGLVVLGLFALAQRRGKDPISFWQLADVLVLGLALGVVLGWAACLLGGCSYGVLGRGFGYMALPDIYGVQQVRFATQIVGLIQAGVLFILFWFLRNRWPFAGAAFLMYSLLYFGGQFFLEFVRGDEALYFGPFRLGQIIEMVLVGASAAGLLILWWRSRRQEEEVEEADEVEEIEEPGEIEAPEAAEGIEGVQAAAEGTEEIEGAVAEAEGIEEAADAAEAEGIDEVGEVVETEAEEGTEGTGVPA
jgi:phosphatidylglycerol:prolipoprotein diacylglycerol transferase